MDAGIARPFVEAYTCDGAATLLVNFTPSSTADVSLSDATAGITEAIQSELVVEAAAVVKVQERLRHDVAGEVLRATRVHRVCGLGRQRSRGVKLAVFAALS